MNNSCGMSAAEARLRGVDEVERRWVARRCGGCDEKERVVGPQPYDFPWRWDKSRSCIHWIATLADGHSDEGLERSCNILVRVFTMMEKQNVHLDGRYKRTRRNFHFPTIAATHQYFHRASSYTS